jgi:acyl carrier protein
MSEPTPSAEPVQGIEARVLDIIAEMSGLERGDIGNCPRLAGAPLDSLTAIAIVTRIEAAFGIVADTSLFDLLIASNFGQLGRSIAQLLEEQRAKFGEAAGNESCELAGDAFQCD